MNPLPPSNNDGVWRQMLEYLDGTLPPDEVRALNEQFKREPELRSVFADVLAQEIKLKELGEEAALAAADAAEQFVPAENIVRLSELPNQPDESLPAVEGRPAPRPGGVT